MNLYQEAQQLTNAAQNLAQAGVRHFNQSVEQAMQMAADLSATAEELEHQSAQFVQQGIDALNGMFETVKPAAFELGAAGGAVSEALKDLPTTAEALAREMPKIADRLRSRAGLRTRDALRSDADVMQLFEKIPGTSKLGANETTVREFLADKHGSHIISRQQGGSNGADNILWEIGADNLRRGARVMKGQEQIYIRFYNAVDSIVKNSGTIAQLGVTATGTAVLTQAMVTAVSYALDLHRGDITGEEFCDLILGAAVSTGIATPIFFLIFMTLIALFPELTLLLSAPAVMAGFNALFGIGIAVPMIQSLIRHVEAEGVGEEFAEGYQNLLENAQQILEPTAGVT